MSGKTSKVLAVVATAAAMALALACAQTDAGITTRIKTEFARDDTVKASQINVDTKDHIVTLSGKVDSEEAKTRAVEIARGTEGVRDVVDNLTWTSAQSGTAVNPPAGTDTNPPAGTNPSGGTDQTSAGQTAQNAPGSQPTSDAAITAAVKNNLMADTAVGASNINVNTKDGVVSLTGSVKNQAEKDNAVRIARQTNGVRDVQDNLTIQAG